MSFDGDQDGLLSAFMADAIEQVLAAEDRGLWLQWMNGEGRRRYAAFFDPLPEGDSRRVLATYLGLSFWSAVPLPRLGFVADPDAIPQPSEACPCGSDGRFVDCCAEPFPSAAMFDPAELWRTLVSALDEVRFAQLIEMERPPDLALAPAGERLIVGGRSARAIHLIEPRFAQTSDLGDWSEDALRTLLWSYDALGDPAGSELAFHRLDETLDDGLRSVLWWMRAVALADEGDLEQASEALSAASRLAPDSPALAPVEIMLTLVLHGPERSQARARFWLARLRRLGLDEDDWPITFLRRAARDPLVAFSSQLGCRPQHAERLRLLIDALDSQPDPGAYETVSTGDAAAEGLEGMEAWLQPSPELAEIEARWSGVFPLDKPYGTSLVPVAGESAWDEATAERWLACLEADPRAFESFEILDDVCLAIEDLTGRQGGFEALHRSLLGPILERARSRLRGLSSDQPGLRLPWSTAANRSALRLLARDAVEAHGDDPAAASASIETVLELDPSDPHGLRGLLADAYLRSQANEDLLGLCARFAGDDGTELLYGKVLALYRLQRMDAACEALARALAEQPHGARFLLDAELGPPAPTLPRSEASEIARAWLYRRAAEDLWQETPGALAWLRGQQTRLAACGESQALARASGFPTDQGAEVKEYP